MSIFHHSQTNDQFEKINQTVKIVLKFFLRKIRGLTE